MKIYHPGYQKKLPITFVLNDLASQEGCDGEPYDQMVAAANYINYLEIKKSSYKKINKRYMIGFVAIFITALIKIIYS